MITMASVPQRTVADHSNVAVWTDGMGTYRAACLGCDWKGPWRRKVEKTHEDAKDHSVEKMASKIASIVSAQKYADAMDREMGGHERAGYLTFHPASEIEAEHMIPILENDGKTGVLIWKHDGHTEAASLFNAAGSGEGLRILQRAIDEYGVDYVEAFEPLNGIYEQLGFHTVDTAPFDPALASPRWNYAHGQPDIHFMVR